MVCLLLGTGYGIQANRVVTAICKAFGVTNVGAKVYGSRNIKNTTDAVIEALRSQRPPSEMAASRNSLAYEVRVTKITKPALIKYGP